MIRQTITALGAALCLSLICIGISKTSPQQVAPGSSAPALDIKAWYKGTPIKALDKNKTYVIDFWATWCGPCKAGMPRLSKLARANKDVTFIGVGVWEEHNKALLKKFVDEMGSDMDYSVCYSGNRDSGMAISWMQAASQNSIPTAFIVKNNQILWIGHPSALEKPLSEIKAGKFDLQAAKIAFDKKVRDSMDQESSKEEMAKIKQAIASKDFAWAKTKIAALEKKYPSLASKISDLKFALFANESPDEWEKHVRQQLAKNVPGVDFTLSMFAMNCVLEKNLALGKRAINLTLEFPGGNVAATYYNAAFFYDQAKDYKEALSLVDKAIKSAETSPHKDAGFQKMLEKMKADLTEKIKRSGGSG